MSVFTEITEFRPSQRRRTIICGSTPGSSAPTPQITDATYTWTDPDSGASDIIGVNDWWHVVSTTNSNGTILADVEFRADGDLLNWLCVNSQVAQIHMLSSQNFTVNVKFLP